MKKLGIVGLTAIVFGSMIGSGIFNLVQNMAAEASVGAVIISWLITAAGMLTLVSTFKILADRRPDLNAGIYQYAQRGFGNYVGFNIAWGYWLCTAFANVAYAVMLNDALGVFVPCLLRHGWPSVIFGSGLIWVMYAIVNNGIHSASIVNTVVTSLKIASLILIIAIVTIFFNADRFEYDFWGHASDLGGLGQQIRSTMLVTLWCFIGIEGAAMMSARAKSPRDVGRAGVIGFLLAWALYIMVSVLAYGVLPQPELAGLGNPSVAYLLKAVCGPWAYYFVIIAVICSLFGGWIAWTLICAQVPYEAARQGIMPVWFVHVNHRGVPTHGLLIASVIMEVFFLLVIMTEDVYLAAIEISGMMVLPAYLFSGIFMVQCALRPKRYLRLPPSADTRRYLIIGVLCTAYCLWLIYAGGVSLMMATSLFYLPGVYYYVRARSQAEHIPLRRIRRMFTRRERCLLAALVICAIVSILMLR